MHRPTKTLDRPAILKGETTGRRMKIDEQIKKAKQSQFRRTDLQSMSCGRVPVRCASFAFEIRGLLMEASDPLVGPALSACRVEIPLDHFAYRRVEQGWLAVWPRPAAFFTRQQNDQTKPISHNPY